MKSAPLLVFALLSLTACRIEQTQPAPITPDERWGHLPPDPERPQQAERSTDFNG